ncbi:hypothetical protein WAI81_21145 [Acinetobacter baumannii]
MGEKIAVAEIQSLSPTAEVELFVIDTTKFGGDVSRLCSGVNAFPPLFNYQGKR